jgi:hypothetical protein
MQGLKRKKKRTELAREGARRAASRRTAAQPAANELDLPAIAPLESMHTVESPGMVCICAGLKAETQSTFPLARLKMF